ncbi:hypothetical protein [Micromonospora noduli]|uniref:hypothetical protein n=1 Tax=Micromonospora noduli TaxID=709876 RepID=UPI001FC93CEB|nr:hypothetical protein [Micromonospora noduli]
MPGARRGAWSLIRGVVVKAAVIGVLLFGAVAYAAVGSDEESAGPAPTQSPTQSEPPHR